MRKRRIGLVPGAFAAVAVSLAGSPFASADVFDMRVTTQRGVPDEQAAWTVDVWVTCDPASSPVAPLIYLTDNGTTMAGSPVTPGIGWAARFGACNITTTGNESPAEIAFKPTTLGTHHIVATQYKPDGSVLSTLARDVNVTQLPGAVGTGSAALPFGS
ncbi:hypothetical protein [Nocardia tengchongensis]